MNEENYFVKLEIFHGVHGGVPGNPYTESYIHDLEVNEKEIFSEKAKNYLVESRLFPTESGYLKAKIIGISEKKKEIEKGKIIRLSTLELILARRVGE